MRDEVARCIDRLDCADRTHLHELPSLDVPHEPGVYALWFKDELLYVGIARVSPRDTRNPQAAGVAGRLRTYRSCRLTSDFAIAVAFRFVVPHLSHAEREGLATGITGVRHVQAMTQRWVWSNVDFSVDIVAAGLAARAEAAIRRAGLSGTGPPAFNASSSAAGDLRHQAGSLVAGEKAGPTPGSMDRPDPRQMASTTDAADTEIARRRLRLWPDPETRLAAARRLVAGEAVGDILADYPDGPATKKDDGSPATPSRRRVYAEYAIKQEAVRAGLVEPISPDNTAAIRKVLAAKGGMAWTECRTGLSPGAIRKRRR